MDTHLLLSLFHIFAVVPFFLYIAFSRASTNPIVYKIAFVLGLFLMLYHGYKAFFKWKAGSQSLWVNMIHILIVGPLLAYIGFYEEMTPRAAYELLALTGFGALGYHIYHLITSLTMVE